LWALSSQKKPGGHEPREEKSLQNGEWRPGGPSLHLPLSFVLGANSRGQRVREYENTTNAVIPIAADRVSWVLNHGPSNFTVHVL